MVTRQQFAKLALAMPEVVQASHFGKPDFRVRNKIFAGLDAVDARASLKVRTEIQRVLIAARPETFSAAAGAWGDSGWTYVMLEHAQLGELRELLADAWQQIAPARLAAQHAADRGPAAELEITRVTPSGASRQPRTARESSPRRTKTRGAKPGKATPTR